MIILFSFYYYHFDKKDKTTPMKKKKKKMKNENKKKPFFITNFKNENVNHDMQHKSPHVCVRVMTLSSMKMMQEKE